MSSTQPVSQTASTEQGQNKQDCTEGMYMWMGMQKRCKARFECWPSQAGLACLLPVMMHTVLVTTQFNISVEGWRYGSGALNDLGVRFLVATLPLVVLTNTSGWIKSNRAHRDALGDAQPGCATCMRSTHAWGYGLGIRCLVAKPYLRDEGLVEQAGRVLRRL
jgi:hypothetical protein